MKNYILPILFSLFLMTSCIQEPDVQPNTYNGNFEALWKIVDTKYCFLDYKHINWDSIHTAYKSKVDTVRNDISFFNLMSSMVNELKDGHVNLYSNFDMSRYWKWYTDYPANYDQSLLTSTKYLGDNFKVASGLVYGLLAHDSIGYIRYSSFMNSFSDINMANAFSYFTNCKGLIIDVRDNGGGALPYADQLAGYFFDTTTTVGYIKYKTGKGHADFSSPAKMIVYPNKNVFWKKPVAILTNRMSFSATNYFISIMRYAPNAFTVGDKSGGGGGIPMSSELPNGWLLRLSQSPMYDASMEQIEWGIDPKYPCQLTKTDIDNGYETIVEKAISILKK